MISTWLVNIVLACRLHESIPSQFVSNHFEYLFPCKIFQGKHILTKYFFKNVSIFIFYDCSGKVFFPVMLIFSEMFQLDVCVEFV